MNIQIITKGVLATILLAFCAQGIAMQEEKGEDLAKLRNQLYRVGLYAYSEEFDKSLEFITGSAELLRALVDRYKTIEKYKTDKLIAYALNGIFSNLQKAKQQLDVMMVYKKRGEEAPRNVLLGKIGEINNEVGQAQGILNTLYLYMKESSSIPATTTTSTTVQPTVQQPLYRMNER